MVLLDEIIEILPLPQFTRAWHDPFRFQFLERLKSLFSERMSQVASTPVVSSFLLNVQSKYDMLSLSKKPNSLEQRQPRTTSKEGWEST